MLIKFDEIPKKTPAKEKKIRAVVEPRDEDGNYLDKNGNKILNPLVRSELERIIAIPHKDRTPKDNIRLAAIRRDGDNVRNKNKFRQVTPAAPDPTTLGSLNKTRKPEMSAQLAQEIIDSIYDGKSPIQSIKEIGATPKSFFNFLDEEEKRGNYSLKSSYFLARECLAEFYLYKRDLYEQQLLAGEIDSSTYAAVTNDIKYLVGKLFPRIYGDRVTIDTNVRSSVSVEASPERIQRLNALLSGGQLPPPVVDVEFSEEK